MKEQTISDLFHYYTGYWILKLKLEKKYKFIIQQDNRICAFAETMLENKNTYKICFNTDSSKYRFQYKWQIIHVVLHELGHIFNDWRGKNDAEHEFEAEYFALKTAKKFYPRYYRKMVEWTRAALTKSNDFVGEEDKIGYTKALKMLGEF